MAIETTFDINQCFITASYPTVVSNSEEMGTFLKTAQAKHGYINNCLQLAGLSSGTLPSSFENPFELESQRALDVIKQTSCYQTVKNKKPSLIPLLEERVEQIIMSGADLYNDIIKKSHENTVTLLGLSIFSVSTTIFYFALGGKLPPPIMFETSALLFGLALGSSLGLAVGGLVNYYLSSSDKKKLNCEF